MKKLNKFLSIILLLSAATGKVAFCMEQEENLGIISNKERIIELQKEEQRKREGLGEISQDVLDLHVLDAHLGLKDLNNLHKSCKILNKMVKQYLETPIKGSNKEINLTLDLRNFNIIGPQSKKLTILQQKIHNFIDNTERTLNVKIYCNNIVLLDDLEKKFPVNGIVSEFGENVRINNHNAKEFKENDLNKIINKKEMLVDEVKGSNLPFFATAGIIFLPAITTMLISCKYLKSKEFNIFSQILLSTPVAICALKLTLNKLKPFEIHDNIQDWIEKF